jgi:hypothetical protein
LVLPGAEVLAEPAARPPLHPTEGAWAHRRVCARCRCREQLIGDRLVDANLRDPDLDEQHLSADRAIQELNRIRPVTFTAEEQTIIAFTRPTGLQQQILTGLCVDTERGPGPSSAADRSPSTSRSHYML